MNILLTLSALPLAIAAVPAAASDCAAASTPKPVVAANEAVVCEMLAYSSQSQRDGLEKDCLSAPPPVDCVDCPEGQESKPQG